jgi:hypothetical protein
MAFIALLKALLYVNLLIALAGQKRYCKPVLSCKLTLLATRFNSTFLKSAIISSCFNSTRGKKALLYLVFFFLKPAI